MEVKVSNPGGFTGFSQRFYPQPIPICPHPVNLGIADLTLENHRQREGWKSLSLPGCSTGWLPNKRKTNHNGNNRYRKGREGSRPFLRLSRSLCQNFTQF